MLVSGTVKDTPPSYSKRVFDSDLLKAPASVGSSWLLAGSDTRLAIESRTGLNKYLCPSIPSPATLCFSSCTASPVSEAGFDRASAVFSTIAGAPSGCQRSHLLAEHSRDVAARVLRHFAAADLADAILCPSGTDALLTTMMLVCSERPGVPVTAILPSASETGTGVPLAAACRRFDGPATGMLLCDAVVNVVEVGLRTADGEPRPEGEVVGAYAAAVAASPGRAVVILTHGTKTGLIAPVVPPDGVDVIVDACQARIAPREVAAYLRQGFPVVVTGSKFYGGPAFSGAVLFPRARLAAIRRQPRTAPGPMIAIKGAREDDADLGTVLRWTAALEAMEAFGRHEAASAGLLREAGSTVERGLASIPMLVTVGGMPSRGAGWADRSSIFTFAVRDPADARQCLSAAALRPLYERMAGDGVLLGQPVRLGRFGGLRIAVGARDLVDGSLDRGLPRLFDALQDALAGMSLCGAA